MNEEQPDILSYSPVKHPEWIDAINKEYQAACKSSNYDLQEIDAKRFALKYSHAYMWYASKLGEYSFKAKFYKQERDKEMAIGKSKAYVEFVSQGKKDSDKARENWVLENHQPYIDSIIAYMKAESDYETVYEYIKGIAMIHYFCKELVNKVGSRFGIESFNTGLSNIDFNAKETTPSKPLSLEDLDVNKESD